MTLITIEVAHLISNLAEPALRDKGLLMRPIPFFARLDQFQAQEAALEQLCENYLVSLNRTATHRFLRAYAFADELNRGVLRVFYPCLPKEGERALRMLWGAAMVMDQLLDEEGVEPETFADMREWVTRQANDASSPQDNKRPASNPELKAFFSMLGDIFTDCRRRGEGTAMLKAFITDLLRMLDAELSSLCVTMDEPPSQRVRSIVRDKSVLLGWVGFQACCLGQTFNPMEARELREICDAIGEVLWIMDDLVDLEEDLERGIWNRALWQLYDDLGERKFRELIGSKTCLVEGINHQFLVAREIDEISKRVAFLENHPRMEDPQKLRALMSFWVTSWLGIYR